MTLPKLALTATLGIGLAASLALPASAATTDHSPAQRSSAAAAYTASGEEHGDTDAFIKAVMKSALAKKAKAHNKSAAVTVTYDASAAPKFKDQIARSAEIWNSSVSNVQLKEGGNADLSYREGNDPQGSYADTDGHGKGYIFLDYAQNEEYDSTRVTAHETGHALGLPDHYEGPCSELMSGGGPGPSCTNSQPDQNETAKVNELWANGLASLEKKLAGTR
ncbi:snapalysin [Streptomyces coffeae]|uniref:Extracellular small neutral protease n=1 Tax=Streptomyces coffeae TaxID=621382 RepID=A0ABS1N6U8_9ACTN|nr:snapalysin [Streptomyces coffeae]MBL1095795.1 snapalysin [Streptomyces coffeae]